MGKGKTGQSGQGNGGGWPSTTGNKSGGNRSFNPPGGGKSSSGSKGGNVKDAQFWLSIVLKKNPR